MAKKGTLSDWLRWDAEAEQKRKQAEETKRIREVQQATGKKVADVVYNKSTGLQEVRNYTGGNTARSVEQTYKKAAPVIQQQRDLYNYTSGGLRPDKEQIKDTKDWRASRRDDGTEDAYRKKLKGIPDSELTYLERQFKHGRIGLDALEPRSKDANRDRGYLVEVDKSVAKGKKSRTDRNVDKDMFIDRFDAGLSAQDSDAAQSVNFKDMNDAQLQAELTKVKHSSDSNDQFKHQNLLVELGRRQEAQGLRKGLDSIKGSGKANDSKTDFDQSLEDLRQGYANAQQVGEQVLRPVAKTKEAQPLRDMFKRGLGIGQTTDMYNEEQQRRAQYIGERAEQEMTNYASTPENQERLSAHDQKIAKEYQKLQKQFLDEGGQMNEEAFAQYASQNGQKLMELRAKRDEEAEMLRQEFKQGGGVQAIEREYEELTANKKPEDEGFLHTLKRRGVDVAMAPVTLSQGAAAGVAAFLPGETANKVEKHYRDEYEKGVRDNIYLRALSVAGDAVSGGVIGNIDERVSGEQAAYRQDSKRLTGAEELGAGIVGGLSGSLVGYGAASKAVIAGTSRGIGAKFGQEVAENYAKKLRTGFLEDMFIGASLDAGFGLANQLTDQNEGIDTVQLASEMVVGTLIGGGFRGALEVPGLHARHLETKRTQQRAAQEEATRQADLEAQRRERDVKEKAMTASEYESLVNRSKQAERKKLVKEEYAAKIEQVKADAQAAMSELGVDPELPMAVNRQALNPKLTKRLDAAVSTDRFDLAPRQEQLDTLYTVFGDLVERVDSLRSADLDATGVKVRQQMVHELVQVQQMMDDAIGTDVPLAFRHKTKQVWAEDQFNLRDMYERYPDGDVPLENVDAYMTAIGFADKMANLKSTPEPVRLAYYQVAEQMRTNLRDQAEVKAQQDLDLQAEQAARLASTLKEVGVDKSVSLIEEMRTERESLTLQRRKMDKQGTIPKEDIDVLNEWFIQNTTPEQKLDIAADLDIKFNKDGSLSRKQKNHTIDQLIRMYVNADEAATPKPEEAEVPPALDFFDKPKRKEVGKWSFQDLNQDQIMEFKQKVEQQYREQDRIVEMVGEFDADNGFVPQTDQFGNPLFVEKTMQQVSETEVVEVPGDTFRVDFMDGQEGKFILRKLLNMDAVEREVETLQFRNEAALRTTDELSANLAQINDEIAQLENFVKENGIDLTSPDARQIPEVKELDKLKRKQAHRNEQIQTAQRRQAVAEELGIQQYLLPHRNSVAIPLPKQLLEDIQSIKDERLFADDNGNLVSVKLPESVDKLGKTEQVGAEAAEELRQKSTMEQSVILTKEDQIERKRNKESLKAEKKSFDIQSLSDIDNLELSLSDLTGKSGKAVRQMLGQYADAMQVAGQEAMESAVSKLNNEKMVKMFGVEMLQGKAREGADIMNAADVLRNISKMSDDQVKALLSNGKDDAERVQARIKLYEPMLKDPALQLTDTELEMYKQWLDTEGGDYLSLKQILKGLVDLTKQHSDAFDRYAQMQDRTLSVKYSEQDTRDFLAALEGEILFIRDDRGREMYNPKADALIKEYEIAYGQMDANPQGATDRINELNKMVEAQYPNAIERVNRKVAENMSVGSKDYQNLINERDQLDIDAREFYGEVFQDIVERGADAKALQAALKKWFPQSAIDGRKVQRFPNDTVEKLYNGKLEAEIVKMYGDDPILDHLLDFIEEVKPNGADFLKSFDTRFNNIKANVANAKRDFMSAAEAPTALDERIARNMELYNEARAAARREQVEIDEWKTILDDQAVYARISKNFKYNVHDPEFKGAIPKGMWSKDAKGASTLREVAQYIIDNNIDAPGVRESLNGDDFDPQATMSFLARLDERKNYKREDVVRETEWVQAVRTALIADMNLKFPSIDELSSADMDTVVKVQRMLEQQMLRIEKKFEINKDLKAKVGGDQGRRAYNAVKEAGLLEGQEIQTVEHIKKVVEKTVPVDVAIPFREVSQFLPTRYADIEAAAAELNIPKEEVVDALLDYVPLKQAIVDMDARIGQADADILDAISNEVDFFGQSSTFRQDMTPEELQEVIMYRQVLASSTLEDKRLPVKSDVQNIIEDYLEAESKEWTATKYMDPDNPSAAKMAELEQLERMGRDERIAQLKEAKLQELEAIKQDELAARAALKEFGNVSPIEKWKATQVPDNSPVTQDLRQLHSAHQVENNGVKQLLPDYTLRVRQYLFSKFARISTWDRSVEAVGHKLTPGSRLLDRFEQLTGRTKARFEQSFSEKFMPILEVTKQYNLSPDDIDKLYKDLANWSNLKWNDDVQMNGTDDPLIRVIPYSVDGYGNVLAPKDANEWYESNIMPWEAQGINVQQIMDMTRQATDDQLERMYAAGFIDDSQYADMKRKAKFGYIPLVPRNKSVDLAPYREALDPDREYTVADQQALAGAQSPFHTLVAREHALAAREEMNRVAHLLHDHVDKLVKGGYDMSPHIRTYEPGMKADGQWGQVVTVFQKGSEPIKYQLSKDYDLLFGFMHEDMGKVEKMLNQISRLDSSLITSRNPIFGLKSLVRDPLTAIQVSGIQSVALDLVPSMIEGFMGTIARKTNKPHIMDRFYNSSLGRMMASDANYQELNARGAVPTSRYDFFGYKPEENTVDASINHANRNNFVKGVNGLDELLKFLSDWSEASSRLIAGRAEYRRTGDMDDAATAATNMLNFSNAGTYRQGTSLPAKTMRLMQFVNPALQGTYGFGKALKRNPVRTMAASASILAPLAYEFATRDEWSEEQNRKYAMLSEYERANNIFIPVGDDFIKFPMPPGIESYPAMVARLVFDQSHDAVPGQDTGSTVRQAGKLLTNSLFPMAEAKIPIIQPLIETALNYSRFYEDEIEIDYNRDQWKKRDEKGMMEGIYDQNSYIAVQLAELTGADSPKKIDYLLQNMPLKDITGRGVDFADKKLREMAGVDKRVKNYSYRDDGFATGSDVLDNYLFTIGLIDPSRARASFYVGDDATVNAGAVYDLYDTVDDEHELGLYPKKEELAARSEYLAPTKEFGELRDREKEIMEGAPSKDRIEQIKDVRKDQRKFMFDFLQKGNK